MIGTITHKNLSPIARDLPFIGKLINSPKHEATNYDEASITSPKDDTNNLQPVTHFKLANLSSEHTLKTPSKANQKKKLSPIGSILKKYRKNGTLTSFHQRTNIDSRPTSNLSRIDSSTQKFQKRAEKSMSRAQANQSIQEQSHLSQTKIITNSFPPQNLPPSENNETNNNFKDFQQQISKPLGVQDKQKINEKNFINGFIINRSSTNQIKISFNSPIRIIKQLLVEGEQKVNIAFDIPDGLKNPPSPETSGQELYQLISSIFRDIEYTPHILSIRKYTNCVVFRERKLCLLWNFNGKVYLGEWDRSSKEEGNKHGVGLEWMPNKYVYFGEYQHNRREGYGIMKKDHGQMYVGCWKDNHPNGWGRNYTHEGQHIQAGQFLNGIIK